MTLSAPNNPVEARGKASKRAVNGRSPRPGRTAAMRRKQKWRTTSGRLAWLAQPALSHHSNLALGIIGPKPATSIHISANALLQTR